jgi:teichuronic acid biosynthesis glycosyltransferase TuaC
LYPNAAQPIRGIFVENRLRHLAVSGEVDVRVVAPVLWFPVSVGPFGGYKEFARVPNSETRHGISIPHPRYPVIPKIGMNVAPYLLYSAMKPVIRRILRDGPDIDLIDAHYFYPDGVAAVMLGRAFEIPVVITARGTDINLIPDFAIPRRQILWAAGKAAGIITVCQALKDELVELGASAGKIIPLRNGVDLEMFQPLDHSKARRELGLSGSTLLSVGYLTHRKGHNIVISALPKLLNVSLLIVGNGEERQNLENLA